VGPEKSEGTRGAPVSWVSDFISVLFQSPQMQTKTNPDHHDAGDSNDFSMSRNMCWKIFHMEPYHHSCCIDRK
jgi:hypothetical protein